MQAYHGREKEKGMNRRAKGGLDPAKRFIGISKARQQQEDFYFYLENNTLTNCFIICIFSTYFILVMVLFDGPLLSQLAVPLLPPPAAATARARHQAELAHLVQRLTRLVQEMGDRGLEPEVYGPAAYLRAPYLQLSTQAARLVERLGLAEGNPIDHLSDLLVAQLRSTGRSQRRERMSLQQALGE